ncbi:MAG: Glycosyltransferase [Parcubacteria group bacterium GW2011_GWA2_49_9]|nr:MAG: Glycosyltransferase [Parcubacteria group bacterium GW2011_GWA2_49_9]
MRILIFSTAYLPFIGGAELAVKEITDRLSPAEFSFDLITLNLDGKQKPKERIGNVNIIRLSCSKILFPFQAFMQARELHRENPYDHVWSVMASYGGFAGLLFKRHFSRVPFILTLQEGDSLSHIYKRAFFIWPFFKMIFTRADHITAISNYLANWAKRMGAKADIHVIPNGVNVNSFQLLGSSFQGREDLRKRLGLKDDDKVAITTSRLVKKNGITDLIQSLQFLPVRVKLLIIGAGELEQQLKLEARTLKLEARVKFLGHVAHEELPRYLHIADIFCRPSLSEGMGSSFVEAMAAGLPVIATPVGGIPDFLKDGETGLFCEVQNPKSIAEKVQLLLSDNNLRNRIVENASKMVQEKYEWDGIAEKMKKVFI